MRYLLDRVATPDCKSVHRIHTESRPSYSANRRGKPAKRISLVPCEVSLLAFAAPSHLQWDMAAAHHSVKIANHIFFHHDFVGVGLQVFPTKLLMQADHHFTSVACFVGNLTRIIDRAIDQPLTRGEVLDLEAVRLARHVTEVFIFDEYWSSSTCTETDDSDTSVVSGHPTEAFIDDFLIRYSSVMSLVLAVMEYAARFVEQTSVAERSLGECVSDLVAVLTDFGEKIAAMGNVCTTQLQDSESNCSFAMMSRIYPALLSMDESITPRPNFDFIFSNCYVTHMFFSKTLRHGFSLDNLLLKTPGTIFNIISYPYRNFSNRFLEQVPVHVSKLLDLFFDNGIDPLMTRSAEDKAFGTLLLDMATKGGYANHVNSPPAPTNKKDAHRQQPPPLYPSQLSVPPRMLMGHVSLTPVPHLMHRIVGEFRLHDALAIIGGLLDQGVDINTRDAHGRTPLHYANAPEMAYWLACMGADPTAVDVFGNTALHIAAGCSSTDTLLFTALFTVGCELNALNISGATPAMEAIGVGRFDCRRLWHIVDAIIAAEQIASLPFAGFESQRQIFLDRTASAQEKCSPHRIDLRLVGEDNFTFLHALILSIGHQDYTFGGGTCETETVALLTGNSPDAAEAYPSINPASFTLDINAATKHDVRVWIPDREGREWFDEGDRKEFSAVLVSGSTPLHLAALMGLRKALDTLLPIEGLDVNAVDSLGRTALHVCADTRARSETVRSRFAHDLLIRTGTLPYIPKPPRKRFVSYNDDWLTDKEPPPPSLVRNIKVDLSVVDNKHRTAAAISNTLREERMQRALAGKCPWKTTFVEAIYRRSEDPFEELLVPVYKAVECCFDGCFICDTEECHSGYDGSSNGTEESADPFELSDENWDDDDWANGDRSRSGSDAPDSD